MYYIKFTKIIIFRYKVSKISILQLFILYYTYILVAIYLLKERFF